jgi:hypothetical protein
MFSNVIACDKREAFAQGSAATKQSIPSLRGEMDCFASLAMTRLDRLGCLKRESEANRRAPARMMPRFDWQMARSERFELPTLGIEIRCSIQLSYERVPGSITRLGRAGPAACQVDRAR